MGKKRRRKDDEDQLPASSPSELSDAESLDSRVTKEKREKRRADKYEIFKVPGYSRSYPEESKKTEFVVFLSLHTANTAFTDKDRMALSKGIREHGVSGVMHLKTINRYKIGIAFDKANNANMFLKNKKLLDQLCMTASIPAGDTEVTGVLTSVPVDMTNKQIFSFINSSKNIIQVRRFMRREKGNSGATFVPTQAVAITFASTILPDYVYLHSWRHEVKIYIPPVKQCPRCMRYGHIAKFCRNAEVCSICTENHNYKTCHIDTINAKCANCKGNHLAISSACPVKKQKIEENKVKSRSVTYSDLFDSKSFPALTAKTLDTQVNNLMKSEKFINILIETITKIVSNKEVPINSVSIRETLKTTLSNKFPHSS